jgi:hypothetical protein
VLLLLAIREKVMTTDNSSNKDREWEERTLCSDESCIGIIGADGRCNECGKPHTGDPVVEDEDPDEDPTLVPDKLLDKIDADEMDGDLDMDDPEEGDSHWADRILCRDDNCIGIIGPDGRCKECGKPLDEDED